MEKCGLQAEQTCMKNRSKALINYYFNKTLASGSITAITDQCVCISTQYCIPLNWSIKLLLPLNNNVFTLPVKIFRYFNSDSLSHIMSAEIVNPTGEYLEYVSRFENRAYRRIPANLEAGFRINDVNYRAFIKNISEKGFSVIFTPYQKRIDFVPGTPYECQLQLPTEKAVRVWCRSRWSSAFFPYRNYGLTKMSGVEVINPPRAYHEFISMFGI
jgi:hypothetical protein